MATAAVVLDTKNLVLDLKIEILAISNPNLTFSTYPLEESTVVPRYYLQKFQTVVKILCWIFNDTLSIKRKGRPTCTA